MPHRRAGECERCNDIGIYGHAATHLATPADPTWPTFRACLTCAINLLAWPDGRKRATHAYTISAIGRVTPLEAYGG